MISLSFGVHEDKDIPGDLKTLYQLIELELYLDERFCFY